MRAHQFGKWLIILSAMVLVAACQPTQSSSAPSMAAAAITPLAIFEVRAEVDAVPAPSAQAKTSSGVYLTAYISPMCTGTVRSDTNCVQPYVGEFVITTMNGGVIADVMTNSVGQVIVNLPPGKYIVGAKTETIYPLAAPVKINVLADRYVHILINLDSGLRRQPAH